MRERGRSLGDRATGRIDETRLNVRMHSRGCIWLPVAHACAFRYWIRRETYVRASRRHCDGRRRWRRQRRRLWVIDIADLARRARVGTLMDMQKCKKRFPRQRGRGCLAGVSKLVCPFREHVKRPSDPKAYGHRTNSGRVFLVDVR